MNKKLKIIDNGLLNNTPMNKEHIIILDFVAYPTLAVGFSDSAIDILAALY